MPLMDHKLKLEPVSRQNREVLILHLIRSPKVISAALNKLKPEHFNQLYEDAFKILWAVSSEYFVAHRGLIPKLIMDSMVYKFLESDQQLEPFRDDLTNFITWAYSLTDDQIVDDYVIHEILQPLIDERVVMPLASESHKTAESIVQSLSSMYNNTRVGVPEATKLFDLTDPSLDELDLAATPTGSVFFDNLLGGMRKGHITGILAPSGGGKTTAVLETGVNVAKQRKHAVIFHYEQSVSKQLRPRIWSAATLMPTSKFASVKAKDLPPDFRAAIQNNQYLDEYLHIFDMTLPTTGNGGIVEIDSILASLKHQGICPEFVAIDWLGPLVKKYCVANSLDFGKYLLNTYNDMLTSCKYNVALKYDTELVITHQLNADAGKKGPNSIPSMYDAAEFKQFANLMDSCLVFGRMDENKIARVFTDKNRGSNEEIFVQLVEDIPVFNVQSKELRAVQGQNNRVVFVDNSNLGQGWE